MSFFSKLIPARFRKKKDRQPEIKNSLPKERENIKKSFAVYCNANHGTADGKMCAKCSALLMAILPKMNHCPYGVTKPVCDRCDQQCFGTERNRAFMEIMDGSRKKMLVRHPLMTVRHKIMKLGVDYAKKKQNDAANEKAESRRKARVDKLKKRREKTD